MEQRWNDIDRENRRTARNACLSATLSTNPTWTALGANSGLVCRKSATNRLGYDTNLLTRLRLYSLAMAQVIAVMIEIKPRDLL
jgi:hypothetical protein